jgi:hypothetical protein
MDWDEVKSALSEGFSAARKFSEQALGADLSNYEHGIVGIEYVATVKVAEYLMGFDRSVFIEKQCRDLRHSVVGVRRLKAMFSVLSSGVEQRSVLTQSRESELLQIKEIAGRYKFGKKDTKRIDIVVLDDEGRLPRVAIEIKIHNGSFGRFEEDVRRISELVQMCADLKVAEVEKFFGVASIYLQEVGSGVSTIASKSFDDRLDSIIDDVSICYPSVFIERCEVCEGEEPIRTNHSADYNRSDENELLRDRMGYRALALVVRKRKDDTVSV